MIALEEKHMQKESPRTHWKQIVSLKQLTDGLTEWESETCGLNFFEYGQNGKKNYMILHSVWPRAFPSQSAGCAKP